MPGGSLPLSQFLRIGGVVAKTAKERVDQVATVLAKLFEGARASRGGGVARRQYDAPVGGGKNRLCPFGFHASRFYRQQVDMQRCVHQTLYWTPA